MKRWLLYSTASILSLLLTFCGWFAWIVSTPDGLFFIVEQAKLLAPGKLKIKKVEGRLLSQVSISEFSYQNKDLKIQFDSFLFSWDAKELLNLKIYIKQLHLNKIEVDLPKPEQKAPEPDKESEPLELPNLKLPVQIVLDDLQINQVKIKTAEAKTKPIIIDSIQWRSTTKEVFALQHFQVKSPLFNLKVVGDVSLTKPHPVQMNLDWSANLPEFTVVGQGELTGDMQKLLLSHTVSQPLAINLNSTIENVLGTPNLNGELTWQEIYWPLKSSDTKDYLVHSHQGKLDLIGELKDYYFELTTKVTGKQIPTGHWTIKGQGNQQQVTIQSLQSKLLTGIVNATGQVQWQPQRVAQLALNIDKISLNAFWKDWPQSLKLNSQVLAELNGSNLKINRFNINLPTTTTQISLQGKGVLGGDNSSFNTNLTWQDLQWPLVSNRPLLNSQQGNVHLSGTLQNYQLALSAKLAGQQISAGRMTATGQGNRQQFTLESLRTNILQGLVNATGKLHWQPSLVGQLNLNLNKISLQEFWQSWPQKLRLNSQLTAQLDGRKFEVKQFQVNLPKTAARLSLHAKGTLAEKTIHVKQANLVWQGLQWPLIGKQSLLASKKGQINLTGTPQNYQIDLQTQVAGTQVPPGKITLTGQGNLQQFTVKSLRTHILNGTINTSGQIHWQPNLMTRLNLNAENLNLKALQSDLPARFQLHSQMEAKLKGKQLEITQFDINLPQTSSKIALQGKGTLAGKNSSFNTALTWQGMQWPLEGKEAFVRSQTGKLNAQGNLQAYQLHLDTKIQGKDIPTGRWQAVGKGDSNRLQLTSLQGKILQGTLDVVGQLRWQPNIWWDFVLTGNHLNPGKHWTKWPGKLALNLSSQGQLKPESGLETQFQIKHVKGKLHQYPFKLTSAVEVKIPPKPPLSTESLLKDRLGISIKHFQLQSDNNRFTVKGMLGQRTNLQWKINAPDLTTFPEAQGRINGNGSLTGPLDLPHLTAKLKAQSVAFQDKRVKNLHADIDINPRTHKKLRLDVVARNLSLGATKINSIQLTGKGNIAKHTLTANLTMPKDRFSVQLQGSFKQPRWQGQLRNISASTEKFGNWQLQAPTPLLLSATEAKLARSCLRSQPAAKFCTQLHWQKPTGSTIQVNFSQLPFNLARAFLRSQELDMTGVLDGKLVATLRPEGTLHSDIAINLSPGQLKTSLTPNTKTYPHQGGLFKLKVNNNGLDAKLNFSMFNQNHINGQLNLPNFTHLPPRAPQSLQGIIEAKLTDLSILPTFVPQAENTQGKVNIGLTLGGTTKKPKITGKIQIMELATHLPDLGLELKDFNMTVVGKGRDTLSMEASVRSGACDLPDCQLNFQGTAQLLSLMDWQMNLNIKGENVEVMNTPATWALASPNLAIEMVPNRIDVTGDLTIPEAMITPPTAAKGAIKVSKDVVIINPINQVEEKTGSDLAISSNVTLTLGNNVSFEAAGFQSRLGGTLVANQQPGKPTVGNGELWIDGTYKAYGQNLKIDKGQIFFTGGLIENPGLNIQAFRRIRGRGRGDEEILLAGGTRIRNDEDVVAGVHIQGSAQSPEIDLFSQPSMDQSNTLSYIVLGKPAAQAKGEEGNLLFQAAASLPLAQGNALAKNLGRQFGFDEAGLSSEGGIEETALVVGKYLSPGLYISYGIGLFDGSKVLRMRYELTKRLTLETETGTQSGIDLRYTIER